MTSNLLFEKLAEQRKITATTRGLFKLWMTLRQQDWMIGRKSVAYKEMREWSSFQTRGFSWKESDWLLLLTTQHKSKQIFLNSVPTQMLDEQLGRIYDLLKKKAMRKWRGIRDAVRTWRSQSDSLYEPVVCVGRAGPKKVLVQISERQERKKQQQKLKLGKLSFRAH